VTFAMTLPRLLLIGSVIYAVIALDARRRARARGRIGAGPASLGLASDRGASSVVVPPGISEVDPQPLTQVAAEAIDPEATRAAHEAAAEQRDRLPVPGENLP
jgi:hypothetical protein